MARNWAIAIGINQYRNLQPLQFAVRDADAMRDYFLNEVSFQQVYTFSDNSPPIQQDYGSPLDSTPTFTTLKRFLRTRFDQPFLQTGDNLWFFFAGHGIRHEDRDYLMPIDGDPGDIDGTAIPIAYVTERLRRSGADNVVLLLDACRNEGRRSGVGVGEEIQPGVITLFSCSPHEVSYEIEAVQQGAFTQVLLQGLRLQGEGNCATVERLDQHLRHYLPQLNQRHAKPRQTPYATVEPAAKYHLILLPRHATVRDAETLKMEAFKAETAQNYELAEQFWIRVLTVSPADPDAIQAIRRLPGQTSVPPIPPTSPADTASGSRQVSISEPSAPSLPRRRVLQILGLGGAGVGGAFLLSRITSSPSPQPSPSPTLPPSPTSTPSTPLPTPSVSPTPLPPGTLLQLQPVKFKVITVDAKGNKANEEPGKAGIFKEALGGGVLLEMMGIPQGSFTMGSPQDELERENDEEPQREVSVHAFLLGKCAITQAQWRAVANLPKVKNDLQLNPAKFQGANYPVEQVSWNDAVEFCVRLSKQMGRGYRLPSEAEWEYACRARTQTPFHFGQTITTDLANYRGKDWEINGKTYSGSYGAGPKGIFREKTTAVGGFPPNAFGLCDMHGNIWEWCLDHWHDNYQGAPTDGSAWIEGGNSDLRLLRGGSWNDDPRGCRSANRNRTDPGSRSGSLGFRVVCDFAWTL